MYKLRNTYPEGEFESGNYSPLLYLQFLLI